MALWVRNVKVISLLILLKLLQVGYILNKSLTRLYILIGVVTLLSTIPCLCLYLTCHITRYVQLNMHFTTSATLFLRHMVTLHRFKCIYEHHGCVSSIVFLFTSDWCIVFSILLFVFCCLFGFIFPWCCRFSTDYWNFGPQFHILFYRRILNVWFDFIAVAYCCFDVHFLDITFGFFMLSYNLV